MPDSKHITELVQRIRKKDLVAMRFLYEYYAREMLTVSYRITNQMQDSEDIIQESFLTAFQEISKLKNPDKFKPWLKRIVVNNSLARLRQGIHFTNLEHIGEFVEEEPEGPWYKDLPLKKVNHAIQQLPDGCRQIFTLYLMEGYKHREIAEMLNISVSNSKSQYRYALKLLRAALNTHAV